MTKQWLSFSLEETRSAAREVARLLEEKIAPQWVLLVGDIGSGKTTFVRHLLSCWGICDAVTSPTFSLIHHYSLCGKTIYHVDLYRIRSEEELEEIGLYELFREGDFLFIEWPELISTQMDFPHTRITFQYGETENTRHIALTTCG